MPRHPLLTPTKTKRILFFVTADLLLSLFSLQLAYLLRFNFAIPSIYWESFWKIYLLLAGAKVLFLALFGLYTFTWRYFGLYETKRLFLALLGAYGAAGVALWIFYPLFLPFPRSAIAIDFLLSLLSLFAIRALRRLAISNAPPSAKEALIYGLGEQTKGLIDAARQGELPYAIKGVIAPTSADKRIAGIPIISSKEALRSSAQTLIVAKPLPQKELSRLISAFYRHGFREFRYANASDIVSSIQIEDLLARRPKDLDKERIARFVKGKTVLITGAGGSIGSELVRQVKAFGAQKIVAVENSEYNLYRLTEEEPEVVPILCDITQKEEFGQIVASHRPHIILHAAAYKHVPLCEANPKAAVRNNIGGTIAAIDAAIAHGVPHFVLISTDKAVNPTSVMGATKRVCELYAQNVPSGKTTISAVRFGNVLGSSGSVIPKFKRQILSGGPVTVTHPQVRRYFMLTSEACQLVLQAASLAKKQEIFILDMGEPVKIVDLAKTMMELMGREVPIHFTGLRPGEKLFEELLIQGAEHPTKYQSIYIATPTRIDFQELHNGIERLLRARDKEEIIQLLSQIVREFRHQAHAKSPASSSSGSHASRSDHTPCSAKTGCATP